MFFFNLCHFVFLSFELFLPFLNCRSLVGTRGVESDAGILFSIIFVVMWVGSFAVTVNVSLLGGNMFILPEFFSFTHVFLALYSKAYAYLDIAYFHLLLLLSLGYSSRYSCLLERSQLLNLSSESAPYVGPYMVSLHLLYLHNFVSHPYTFFECNYFSPFFFFFFPLYSLFSIATFPFFRGVVAPTRMVLAIYPVGLFFAAITWLLVSG